MARACDWMHWYYEMTADFTVHIQGWVLERRSVTRSELFYRPSPAPCRPGQVTVAEAIDVDPRGRVRVPRGLAHLSARRAARDRGERSYGDHANRSASSGCGLFVAETCERRLRTRSASREGSMPDSASSSAAGATTKFVLIDATTVLDSPLRTASRVSSRSRASGRRARAVPDRREPARRWRSFPPGAPPMTSRG